MGENGGQVEADIFPDGSGLVPHPRVGAKVKFQLLHLKRVGVLSLICFLIFHTLLLRHNQLQGSLLYVLSYNNNLFVKLAVNLLAGNNGYF